jgi:hypothetical protein
MLPSAEPITSAIVASVPGSFRADTRMRAGKRSVELSDMSHRTSTQRSGSSSKRLSWGEWIG